MNTEVLMMASLWEREEGRKERTRRESADVAIDLSDLGLVFILMVVVCHD